MKQYDIIVIGGGLAGLTAALHLAANGFGVLLLEKHLYPRHKVCGEYVSNEVRPYLHSLGLSLEGAIAINRMQLTTLSGHTLQTSLPLGGMGISRYALDTKLYDKAREAGADFGFETVTEVSSGNAGFTVTTATPCKYKARVVIGAYGKRAGLDKGLGRRFMEKPSPWLAVKAHYSFSAWPENQVGLFAFRGGYAGLSQTETGALNFCYLASYSSFRKFPSIENYNSEVLSQNAFLKEFLTTAKMLFERPLSIAQISFNEKQPVVNNMLMCGDTAGMIHPLCGNGMAMAIHSAKIASELITHYFRQGSFDHQALVRAYRQKWQHTFTRRLAMGRKWQTLLLNEQLSELAMATVAKSPWLIRKIIRSTHGKPIGL